MRQYNILSHTESSKRRGRRADPYGLPRRSRTARSALTVAPSTTLPTPNPRPSDIHERLRGAGASCSLLAKQT